MLNIYKNIDLDIKYTKLKLCPLKCNECCTDYFYISFAELLTIFLWIQENQVYKTPFFQNILQSSIGFVNSISESYKTEFEYYAKVAENLSEQKPFVFASPQKEIKSKCIFLNKNDLCSIYPVRPTVCRIFGCTTSTKCNLSNMNSTIKYEPLKYFEELCSNHLYHQSIPLAVGFSLENFFDFMFPERLSHACFKDLTWFQDKYFIKAQI